MIKRKEEFSLKELINIFIPKLWIIIIVSLAFGTLTTLYAATRPDTYTSTVRIHVVKEDLTQNISSTQFTESYLETYIQVISYRKFKNEVLDNFKNGLNDSSVANELKTYADGETAIPSFSLSASANSGILSVSVTTSDAYVSYALANSVANVIKENNDLTGFEKDLVRSTVVEDARVSSANDHQEFLYAFIGVLAGAILSMAVIFLVDMMDVVIHDKKKIDDNFDIPVLGVIPRFISDEGKAKK